MIDALYRNYKVVLLRDCALAFEMPDERPTWAWTKRMTLWTESFLGVTITAEQFTGACKALPGQDPANE
jgi:ureidoacrylate peracid hydrolase